MQQRHIIPLLMICLLILFHIPQARANETVRIGHACLDENGGITGGKLGDQTGKEVKIGNWYCHEKGWVIYRAKSPVTREIIASTMEAVCNNDNVGYDQQPSRSLYSQAKLHDFDISKIDKPCGSDCSKTVWVCMLAAGIDVESFSTYYEHDRIMETGLFIMIDDKSISNKSDYLVRGDILCTPSSGHTCVVLDDGPMAPSQYEICPEYILTKCAIQTFKHPFSILSKRLTVTYHKFMTPILYPEPERTGIPHTKNPFAQGELYHEM